MRNEDVESSSSSRGSHRRLDKDGRGGGYAFYYTDGSERERKWTSWLIPVVVVINVAMFILVMLINDCPKHSRSGRCVASFLGPFSFQPLRENPLLGPSSSTLLKLGALDWNRVVHRHQGWRLCSAIWLHAGLIHLIANMLSVLFIGIRLEQQFGFVRIGIVYLFSGFGGSVLACLFNQEQYISVGASGALFGLLGAMLSEIITNWTIYSNKAAALVTLMIVIAINLGVGILPHVDNFAHIGGFLTGFFLGFILLIRPHYGWMVQPSSPPMQEAGSVKSKHMVYQYILMVISLTLLVAGFVIGLLMLFRGKKGNEHCHWCRYLSCVPTSRWDC